MSGLILGSGETSELDLEIQREEIAFFASNGDKVMTINPDGSISVDPSRGADEAAKTVLKALQSMNITSPLFEGMAGAEIKKLSNRIAAWELFSTREVQAQIEDYLERMEKS